MRKKSTILIGVFLVLLGSFLLACKEKPAAPPRVEPAKPVPTQENFKAPAVTLNSVQVPYYSGWWYFSNKVAPTKGKAGNYGAPLDLAFIFDIENPNPYPVMMEGLRFTVGFEEFDVNTVCCMETQWIPAGKTNQVRVHAISDARAALLSLLVTGGFKLKEKGVGAFDQLEKWWVEAPDFSFPVHVK